MCGEPFRIGPHRLAPNHFVDSREAEKKPKIRGQCILFRLYRRMYEHLWREKYKRHRDLGFEPSQYIYFGWNSVFESTWSLVNF